MALKTEAHRRLAEGSKVPDDLLPDAKEVKRTHRGLSLIGLSAAALAVGLSVMSLKCRHSDQQSNVSPSGMESGLELGVASPQAAVKPDLSGAVGYMEKFRRRVKPGEPSFKVGEIVTAPFLAEEVRRPEGVVEKNKMSLSVDFKRLGIDEKRCDRFIVDAPDELRMQYVGLPITAAVRVTGEGKYQISDIFHYPGELLFSSINILDSPDTPGQLRSDSIPSNPSMKVVEAMGLGDSAVVEGMIAGFETASDGVKYLVIESEDGIHHPIRMFSDSLRFGSSVGGGLENLHSKSPEIGDKVRINAFVAKPERGASHRLGPEDELPSGGIASSLRPLHEPEIPVLQLPNHVLAMYWSNIHLLNPSPDRGRRYVQERVAVSKGIDSLSKAVDAGDYRGARVYSSSLVKGDLTVDEREQLKEEVGRMPSEEQPLIIWNRFSANKLNSAYGVDIDSMTKGELHIFAMSVANCKRTSVKEGSSNILDFSHDCLPPEQAEEVITSVVDNWGRHLREVKGAGGKPDFGERYMFERAVTRLGTLGTPTSVSKLFQIARRELIEEVGSAVLYPHDLARSISFAYEERAGKNPDVAAVFSRNTDVLAALAGWSRKEGYSRYEEHFSKMINDSDPIVADLTKGDFNQNLIDVLAEDNSPIFSRGLAAAREQGYKFKIYDRLGGVGPEDLDSVMQEAAAAVLKDEKTVYVHMNRIRARAIQNKAPFELQLKAVLGNELVSVLQAGVHPVLDADTALTELRNMRGTDVTQPNEKRFQETVSEEVLSAVAEEIILRRGLGDSPSQVAEWVGERVEKVKGYYAKRVFEKVYGVEWMQKLENAEAESLITGTISPRVDGFIGSGGVEDDVVKGLKDLGMLTDEIEARLKPYHKQK
ncbi:MAG: hypothetical protein KKD39_04390 [Candidatus Altiarchaeota archaeon]|nr:hypothetical protein [Candidatus Altiarchaeota archaeon]